MTDSPKRDWRRATLLSLDGQTLPISDDWVLRDKYGQLLGRITRQKSGHMSGSWYWYCFVNAEGVAYGVSGSAKDGASAKAIVEERIPLETFHREAWLNADREFRRKRAIARRKGKL